ncbi:MAG: hypothetical protein ACM3NQ_20720, partial [Bacteroidales bacterium]
MSKRIVSFAVSIAVAAIGATTLGTVQAQQAINPQGPFHTSPADEGKRIEARKGVVTSANALASEAGVEILRAGGNAVDA